jgi:hypothetical protein
VLTLTNISVLLITIAIPACTDSFNMTTDGSYMITTLYGCFLSGYYLDYAPCLAIEYPLAYTIS